MNIFLFFYFAGYLIRVESGTIDKAGFVEKARLAEQDKRYDDMASCMRLVVEMDSGLASDERILLPVAYKNVAEALKFSWRAISNIETKADEKEKEEMAIVKDYRVTIEQVLVEWCNVVIKQIDRYLTAKGVDSESKVVYLKLKGDFYRYLAEVQTDEEKNISINESLSAYKMASSVSYENLEPTNPIHLNLALELSLFYHEIMGDRDMAYTTTQTALDEATAHLEDNQDSTRDFSNSTSILHRLREYSEKFDDDDQVDMLNLIN